jgi:trans-2,3-dihydro-3-hydroxyanthranilate isomerase
MRLYRYLHLDVFTDRLFGGNQLAVVLDGRGLNDAAMQAIAFEMNFSETTFVWPAERAGTDMRVRIFTPREELPMAGHPTIGTAFALACTGVLEPGRSRVIFGLGVGPTDVDLTWKGDTLAFAWMTQPLPTFGAPIADRAQVADALRVPASAIIDAALPVQVVSCGVPYLMVPLATRRDVDAAAIDASRHSGLLRTLGIEDMGVFVFSVAGGDVDGATAYSRMFAPPLGIAEDPATGSAAGPLGCYLLRHRIVAADRADAILVLQGVKMGRPSYIHVAIGGDGTDVRRVGVGGESVLVGEGTIHF